MITDFGISHAVGDRSLTSTGMVSGTPAFLAPEVARGAPSGFPADVFSLGATLYAALEGQPPFGTDQNPMAILHKVASGRIISPRRSGALSTLLLHMLARNPLTGPSMSAVARLLTDSGHPTSGTMAGADLPTVAAVPQTVREWPAGRDEGASSGPAPAPGRAISAAVPVGRRSRYRAWVVPAATVVLLAAAGAWLLAGGTRRAQPTAGTNSGHGPAPSSATRTRRTTSIPAVPAAPTEQPTSVRHPVATRRTASAAPTVTESRSTASASAESKNVTSKTAGSRTAWTAPTAGQLATSITDYYAVLPADTDQGWADLSSGFQRGAAQNRQYYEPFWTRIQRLTAMDARGARPDTAEATITYYFRDGRTAVEITVYSLVLRGGALKTDSSEVLSSTIR